MGVFAPRAGGWGLVFTLLVCSPFGVCAFGVGALAWGGGTVWSRRPLPRLLACVLTLWCGRL